MPAPLPALRRGGIGVAAGMAVGGLVAMQTMDTWPPLRSLAIVLTPLPLVLATVRAGLYGAAAAFGMAALLFVATPLGQHVPTWAFLVGYGGVVAYVLFVASRMAAVNALLGGGLLLAAGLATLDLAAGAQEQGHTWAAQYQALGAAVEAELTQSPALAEMEDQHREQMLRAAPIVRRMLPAITVGRYAGNLALATWACVFALRRLRWVAVPRLELAAWRLPEWTVIGFLVPAAGLLLAVWRDHAAATTVMGNLLLVMLCVYLAQGCAIMHAFLRRLRAHPLVEGILFLTVLFVMPLLVLVMVAGLFDFHVDFRRRWMPPSTAPDERPQA